VTVEVVSFGCRLNLAESDAMRAHAVAAGAHDLVIVNTCAVTAAATRQGGQAVRKAARDDPNARVIVTGCAAQIEPARFAAMPEVVAVIGNDEKMRPETWARLAQAGTGERVQVGDIMLARGTAAAHATPGQGRTRAFLQVQNGCDHRCTFCVIPFGRGRSRSVPVATVIRQAETLVEAGAREIVLTGVDMTSYGADLESAPRLGTLVGAILRGVPDLPRLRLSSIDSIEADPELLEAFALEPRLMPHLHLSLQAGDDLVLKRMKRRHSRHDAIAFCERVRRLRPDVAFGADLIAGFPTEDEAMFRRSLDIVAECGLAHLHVFPYSPRPGTPAARMPQVAREVVTERAARLRQAGAAALAARLAGEVGTRQRVLTEFGGTGRTEGFSVVRFAAPVEPGQIVETLIAAQDGRELLAA
jgi:threonylcarbamoyladenosine tRNA methylthiotransferase MtaB